MMNGKDPDQQPSNTGPIIDEEFHMTEDELMGRYINPTATMEQTILQNNMVQFKIALISPALFNTHMEKSNAAYFRKIAAVPRIFPDGKKRKISVKTLERWKRNYTKIDKEPGMNGMDALKPKTRSDKGKSRKLRLNVMMEICKILHVTPNIKCTVLKRTLERRGIIVIDEVSADTIRRFIIAYDLRVKAEVEKRIRRSFVYEEFGQLWEADTCYLFKIPKKGAKKAGDLQWVYIQGIIDDHTRKILALKCYLNDSAENYLETLRTAILQFGIPVLLYHDNGSAYTANIVTNACNKMGITLIHTRANDGAAKACIERAWFSLEIEVIPEIVLDGLKTLEQIQDTVDRWRDMYNARINTGVNGIPNERYEASIKRHSIRRPKSEEWLTECMMLEEYCHIYNDNTIQKDCIRYALPDELALKVKKGKGKTLPISYYPGKIDETICTVFNGKKYMLYEDDREKNAHAKRNTGGRKAELAEKKQAKEQAKEQEMMSLAEARAQERFDRHTAGIDLEKFYSQDVSEQPEQKETNETSTAEVDIPVSDTTADSVKISDKTEDTILVTDMSALFD